MAKYLVTIPSKGRAEVCAKTILHLMDCGVNPSNVLVGVEPQEYGTYKETFRSGPLRRVIVHRYKRNNKGVCYARQATLEAARKLNPKYVIYSNDNIRMKKGCSPLDLLKVFRMRKDALMASALSNHFAFMLWSTPPKKIRLVEPRVVAIPRKVYQKVDFDLKCKLCEDTVYILRVLMTFPKGMIYSKKSCVFNVTRFKPGGNMLHVKSTKTSYKKLNQQTVDYINRSREYRKTGVTAVMKLLSNGEWDMHLPGYSKVRRDRVMGLK